jgi:hypothetical protein
MKRNKRGGNKIRFDCRKLPASLNVSRKSYIIVRVLEQHIPSSFLKFFYLPKCQQHVELPDPENNNITRYMVFGTL